MNIEEEKKIIACIKEGDANAYRDLVNEYSEKIYIFVKNLLSSESDAQDITQEVFVKGFFKLDKFRGESSFYSWLYRIAYNESISFIRKNKKKISLKIEYPIDIIECMAETQDEKESKLEHDRIIEKLKHSIEKLDAEEQFLINGFYYKNMGICTLSDVTGLSESNVKVRLFRIKKKLNKIVGRSNS